MRPAAAVLAAAAAFCWSLPSSGKELGNDVPPLHPDFSYAGYAFGERQPPTPAGAVVDARDFGAVPDDDVDDTRALERAFAAAHATAGPVVLRLPAGRLIVSGILPISRSDFFLVGAGRGAGGTEVFIPRPLRMVDDQGRLDAIRAYLLGENKRQVDATNNINLPFSPYSWTGGFLWVEADDRHGTKDGSSRYRPVEVRAGRAFSRWIKPVGEHDFAPGDIVQLRWSPREGARSGIIGSLYGPSIRNVGSRHFEQPDRPLVVQTSRITRVLRGRIELADPLLHDVRADQPADLARWRGLTNVGIQDLAIVFAPGTAPGHHLEEGWNAIHFADVFDGWIRSLRVVDADSAILTYRCGSVSILDVETSGSRSAHYAVHLGDVHNVLVERLHVKNRVVHPLTFNTQSTRSVYHDAIVEQHAVLDQHAGANHQNLFDTIRMRIEIRRDAGHLRYALWDGSGAPYWQPGHGRFNTTWNVQVLVESGASVAEPVVLTGLDEGPEARIVGVWGNRDFSVDYRPQPMLRAIGAQPDPPSLYRWQRARRLGTN